MRPQFLIALQKLVMLCGMFIGFGLAMATYDRFGVNLPLLPLWVNLVAIIGPILGGAWLAYWLVSRIPIYCPTCRGRIERRIERKNLWKMLTDRFWCEVCRRDALEGFHGPTNRSARKPDTRDTARTPSSTATC